MHAGQRRTRRRQETTGRTVRRHPAQTAEERGPGGPRTSPGHCPPQGADPSAPGRTVRAVRVSGDGARSPDPQTRRPRNAQTASNAGMDGNHGPGPTQDPRGLSALPQHHPQPAANRITHAVITGEPGAGKPARRVREGDAGKGPKGTSPASYLAVILDVFSRYAVGWMVATGESAALAEKLIADTCAKQQIAPGQLTVHADRGSSMTSKPVAFLLADLGITQSHSRPRVSNDNPYSEAQFKTLKYRPDFPTRFDSIEGARAHCREFFAYYNDVHRHSGLGLHTPADVHLGHAPAVQAQRAQVLTAAYLAHPERFVHRPPTPPVLPSAAWINPLATNSSDPDNTEAAAAG